MDHFVTGIRTIEHKVYPTGNSCGRHGHPKAYELIYVDYGCLTLILTDHTLHLQKNQAVIIRPGSKHQLKNEESIPANYLNIIFFGEVPQEICNQTFILNQEGFLCMSRLREENKAEKTFYEEVCRNELANFLIFLLRRKSSGLQILKPLPPAPFRSKRARKIFETVSENYREIEFNELARRIGVSRSTLYLIFRDEIGKSFSELIGERRLEDACYLLHRGEWTLPEVAEMVGCDLSSLFRLFKRIAGMTPGEYLSSLGLPQKRK